jgi:hypothetical protein
MVPRFRSPVLGREFRNARLLSFVCIIPAFSWSTPVRLYPGSLPARLIVIGLTASFEYVGKPMARDKAQALSAPS